MTDLKDNRLVATLAEMKADGTYDRIMGRYTR